MKKILWGLSIMPICGILPLTTISCKEPKNIKVINFAINKPWYGENNDFFFQTIANEYNKIKDQDLTKIEIKPDFVEANASILDSLKKGSSDVAILTSALYENSSVSDKSKYKPFIQTTTTSFVFDQEYSTYVNGSNEDPLIKIAKEAEKTFNLKPFLEWNDEEYQWNGSLYKKFYNESNLVSYYRGAIWIWGTKSELIAIKNAWDNKDWNAFRNFGILLSDETSGSKYQIQEKLFQKHFNKPDQLFQSFAFDKLKHNDKYKIGKAKDMGKGANVHFHIVFDELGSFAYTHNYKLKNNQKEMRDYYRPSAENTFVEMLTVTDPIEYNKFVASNKLSTKEIEFLQKAILKVWKDGKDSYGPTVGFNGYKIIKVE
ncbi:ABC transporter thiamine pyrophosphate-binding lipoprotein p37/Cypl [[Mycoplasma] anseris]|uniref:Alkylphosphonate ABC transporter substrate-binidng protein n=1 Tax=[Mycoplasma] anseris TaxID=92400 RepID=A0A2Z4NCQ4_9BACT|nr:hypothetical protein [[Mycoplasma] anseris]AWX69330.1 alkylphosphonate ABC transporter substrate-binidng protein [[Mycoplasma] anseris]